MCEQVALAARNNAVWCDTICRAHGKPGTFLGNIWYNHQQMPPFYPNAVTLTGTSGTAEHLAAIDKLIQADIVDDWAVKDSFCSLDLSSLGFQLLFEATWLWRPTTAPLPTSSISGVQWRQVTSDSELAAWEAAWSGTPANDTKVTRPRIFLPTLLADEHVAFIAAYQGQHIVAGAIANRTGEVVGLSNVFTPSDIADQFWAGCVTEASKRFSGLPLVGYEAGLELATAQVVGFVALEPLRIWGRLGSTE